MIRAVTALIISRISIFSFVVNNSYLLLDQPHKAYVHAERIRENCSISDCFLCVTIIGEGFRLLMATSRRALSL